MIINKSVYPVPRSIQTISNMQKQMDSLLQQLATGKRYNSLAEIGQDRVHDLNLRSRIGRIEGYKANIQTIENRLSFQTNALERLAEIKSDAKALALPNAFGTDGLNLATSRQQATNLLKEVVDVLNTDVVGQHIFGGHATDTKPVSPFDLLMKGTAQKAGFDQVLAERLDADKTDMGRLELDRAGATVTLAEDGDHPFGFKLLGVTGNAATLSHAPVDPLDPDGAQGIEIDFTAQPQPGQDVTIAVSYPDDRDKVEYITLKATAEEPVPAGSFLIGDTEAETAENFEAALARAFETLVETDLHSASTYAAADNFFNGSGEPVMRVAGGPPADTLVADENYDDTVRWYNGQDVGPNGNSRQTVTANVDETTKVNYGVQANEYGINELVKALAVFSVTDFADVPPQVPGDPDSTPESTLTAKRYDALVARQRGRLSSENNARPGSIEVIAMELALANVTMDKVKSRHTQYDAQLKTMLAGIEEAPVEEVAMQLLTLETRLNASYQVTAMVNQLTLVNYLR